MEQYSGNPYDLKEYNRINLRVSTTFRQSESQPHTNCEIPFNNASYLLDAVKKIDITGIDFPNNIRNIASYCNRFILQVFVVSLVEHTITIPPNYYNAVQLALAIQNAIQVYVPTATFIFDSNLRKFVMNSNSPTGIGFAPDNTQATTNLSYNNFMWLIGNALGTGITNTQFVFTNEPNLVGASAVYLNSDILANGKGIRNQINSESLIKNISSFNSTEAISFFVDSAFGAYNVYYNNGSERGLISYQTATKLASIDLNFTDCVGNTLEQVSNNLPIFVSLSIYY